MRYNLAKKLVSSLLAASLLVSTVPMPVQASGNASSRQEEDQEMEEIPYYGESDSEDTETSTTFVAADGKKTSIFFQEAVRFPDGETGELKEYDPSLTEVSEEDASVISGLLSKENGADRATA